MRGGRLLLLVLAAAAIVPLRAAPRADDLLVFAASSLKTALDETEPACRRATGIGYRASYAASSALARQIEAGAPADLFISADTEWVDYLGERALIRADTRVNLLTNRLVLIAPKAQTIPLRIAPGFPLAAALGGGRLAVADPAVVPAGKYARAALVSLGVWDSVATRLAPAENVRAALLLVSRGEAPLGIVYHSDAVADAGVVTLGTFPADSHPPVVYAAAVTRTGAAAAARLLSCLGGEAAGVIFERWGFGVRPPARR